MKIRMFCVHGKNRNDLPIQSLVLLVLVAGCGGNDAPPLSKISGKVISSGKPLTHGMVSFASEEGFGASASIDEQGNYTLSSQYGSGIPVGTYSVTVTPPPREEVDMGDGPPSPAARNQYPEIPMKYRDFSTSGLQFTVEQGRQTFDLNLSQ